MPTSGICRVPSGRGSWCDHDDLAEEQHAGADGAAGPPRKVLGPARHPRAELEGVEVDVAEPQRRGSEPVAAGVAFLLDHAVREQGADDPVHGGRGQVEAGGDLAEAHPPAALQHREDAQRAIHRLDHRVRPFRLAPNRGPLCCTEAAYGPDHIRHNRMISEIVDHHTAAGFDPVSGGRHGRTFDHPETRGRSDRDRVLGVHRRRLGARDAHRQRGRAVHDGRPGHDLVRVRDRRRGDGVRARPHLRQPHQPGRHPRTRGHRQVPVVAGARLHRRAGGRRDHRCRRHHRRARHGRPRRRPGRRDLFRRCQCRTGVFRRVRGYVHSRVHRLRRDTPQGLGGIRRGRHRSGGVRGDHPGRTDHRRVDQPGPHLRPDARPADRGRLGRSGASCRSISRAECLAGVLAAFAYVAISQDPGRRPTPAPARRSRPRPPPPPEEPRT